MQIVSIIAALVAMSALAGESDLSSESCREQGVVAATKNPVKFLFMSDLHVESDWVQSVGAEKGRPVYTCWKPGDHAALTETFRFISNDEYCRDISVAIFGGDQINTGYLSHENDLAAEMTNYWRILESLDIHQRTKGTDLSDMAFTSVPSFVCSGNLHRGQAPVEFVCKPPLSRVIAIQGNHDTGVGDFYRECAFTVGDVRFITFFASYCGLPSPRPGVYLSAGVVSDGAVDFIEREMASAADNARIRHIVLISHWAIADRGRDFWCPISGPCKENGMNRNRDRLLTLCEKYGCDLYLNGHEHNGFYPVARVGCLADVNCGTPLKDPLPQNHKDENGRGAFAIVEVHQDRAILNVYSRAAVEEKNGSVVCSMRPRRLFSREIPLKSIR